MDTTGTFISSYTLEIMMESGKKLEQALASAVDDSLKKGKTVAGAGVVTNAKSKPNQPAAARGKKPGKPGKNSKKKGPGNNQGGGHDALGARMGGKITGDVISEEMDDEGQESAAMPSAMDVIDPDSKTLEDFYRKCEDDDPKWNSILDVQGPSYFFSFHRYYFAKRYTQ